MQEELDGWNDTMYLVGGEDHQVADTLLKGMSTAELFAAVATFDRVNDKKAKAREAAKTRTPYGHSEERDLSFGS